MPKIIAAKTVRQIAELARKEGTFPISPRLYVQAKGGNVSLLFRFRSPVTSKTRAMGLGKFDPVCSMLPTFSPTIGRRVHELAEQVAAGLDPLKAKHADAEVADKREVARIADAMTFAEVVTEFLRARGWPADLVKSGRT